MMHKEVKDEINRLFTSYQRKALEEILQEDPKTSFLVESFRNYDLRCLLSTSYISDPVLEAFQHTLTCAQTDVYFVAPTLFKYLQDFSRSGKTLFEKCDFSGAKYIFWSLNIKNWH